jgi:hypothetical protein
MTRLSSKTADSLVQRQPQFPEEPIVIIESRLNGGMNTYVDPADLQNFQMQLSQNCEIRADKIQRRPGTEDLGTTKPNSDPVLLYTAFKRFDGSTIYLRFTKNKLYRLGVGSWTEITSASAFSITNTTRIRFTTLNDRFFFTVGNKDIQEVNFTANTYADLGNAGAYKYITGFFNRLVGANLYDVSSPNPTLVAHSGDINFAEWDALTDISAGSTPLLEAATDFADPISGLFGFASVMLILRERSLWTATKRPVASSPFQFQASFPYAGCDTPNSATQKRNGIVWYDNRSNQIYDYTIGQAPREIGNPIRDLLPSRISSLDSIMGAYDTVRDRYHLLIPSETSSTTYEYVFDFGTESWVENTRENVTSIAAVDGGIQSLLIDDLSGTIDALIGNINDLTNTTINPPRIFYGLSNGDIVFSNSSLTTDAGASFTSTLTSKLYTIPNQNIRVRRLAFKYIPVRVGTFTISFSVDNGVTWETYEQVTIFTNDLNKRKRILCTKQASAPEFCWRITMESANIQLLEYSMDALPSPFTKSF